ncbi:MAG: ABC transporter permease, partial [Blastocatellia bacterium]
CFTNPQSAIRNPQSKGGIMQTLWQDLRSGARMLVKNPGFALIAIITLALGIGANTAIFSVVNAVLLRPLPYEHPERLVLVWEHFLRQGLAQIPVSASEFTDYRDQNRVFERIAAFNTVDYNLTGADTPERLPGAVVSASVFPLLGVKPLLGRTFTDGENQSGSDNVVVVSHGLWRRRFGADPNFVGKTLTLDGRSYTVVGVMPQGFQFPMSLFGVKGVTFTQPAELWTPVVFTPRQLKIRGSRAYGVIGRLKPNVTLAQANADAQSIANRMLQQYPNSYTPEGWGASVVSLHDQVVGKMRPALLVLLGAVGFVLLIACANVANLMLVRAAGRVSEMAIRVALGAARRRLVRQLLTESMLLALLGGALGLILAWWGVELLVALSPDTLPRMNEVALDRNALGFTLLLSILTGTAFGLAPILQISKLNLNESLKEGSRRASGGSDSQGVRRLSVIVEFALAVALLLGAGLMIKSFWRLMKVDPGFDPQNVLTFQITLPRDGYGKREEVISFYQRAVERVKTLPGVSAAGATTILPLSGSNEDQAFIIEGRTPRDLSDVHSVEFRIVTPDYFRAMGIPLLAGRYFTDADHDKTPNAAIVNQRLARRHFPGEDPVGKRFTMDDPREPGAVWLTIVGVVGDVKHRGLNVESEPEFYAPHRQYSSRSMIIVARTASDPTDLAAAVHKELAGLDRNLPAYNTRTMERVISESVAQQRMATLLLGVLAALAFILAAVGVYGVMSYGVAQRTHEISIRMALGAQTNDVVKLVMGQGMKLAGAGVLIGLAGAWALTRLMKTLLFGVSATDPLTFIVIPLSFTAVAMLACYIPARRATKVDPMVALHCE